MSAEYRLIEVAQGHRVRVRRCREQPARGGFVRVEKSHRPPFEIAERVWNDGIATRGG